MNTKSLFALLGASTIWVGMLVSVFFVASTPRPDRFREIFARNYDGPLSPTERDCDLDFLDVSRDVRLHRSFNVTAIVNLQARASGCKTRLEVSAAAFEIKPESVECKLSDHSSQQTQTVYFNVLPKEAGAQQIIFVKDGPDGRFSRTMEFTVYEYPHIPPEWSFWFPTISFILGGSLTIPWWTELQRKSKDRRDKQRTPQINKNETNHERKER
jgi:hypothetical protein